MTLDLQGAMQRLGNDLSLFHEFIGFYEEDYPRLLKAIQTGAAGRNAEAIHHAAHSLKGLVASVGATDIVATCTALERMGRSGDLAEADETVQKLEADIERFNRELSEFRATQSKRK